MDDKDYSATVAEIREWLVRIDTNQAHQTKLLETLTKQADNAFQKADGADDKAQKAQNTANEALRQAQENKDTFERYEQNEKVSRRWLIGLLSGAVLSVLATLARVYLTG